MRTILSHSRMARACAVAGAVATPVAWAQFEPPVEAIEANLVGIGVGSVPDYSGSSNSETAVAPILRYQFEGSKRYVLWLGPKVQLNLIDDSTWRAGPMIVLRPKRDSDVDDAIVSKMKEIDSEVAGGAFVQYNLKLSARKLHQLVFSGDVVGAGNGTVANLRLTYWHPFSEGIFGNIGVGVSYANAEYNRTYYGVDGSDIALFPSLGGRAYDPGSDTSINVPFGISFALSRSWLLSAGGRYEHLGSEAKDSPIVSERGDSSQWIYGIGVSYLF